MASEGRVLAEYLRYVYRAADGLWFVKVEEALGFEQALELDRRVWEVLAKIQARKARELLGCVGHSVEELARCFSLKLMGDGHVFGVSTEGETVRFSVERCPWLELLRKSKREHIALQIAKTICLLEGRVWCAEFGGEYEFEMPLMACASGERCEMRFTRKAQE
jgi:hypothetical protein